MRLNRRGDGRWWNHLGENVFLVGCHSHMAGTPGQGGASDPKAATDRFASGYELALGYSTVCQGCPAHRRRHLHRDMTYRARTFLGSSGGGECGVSPKGLMAGHRVRKISLQLVPELLLGKEPSAFGTTCE